MTQTWTICPSCGIGKGTDHKTSCPRRKRPPAPNHAKPMSLSERLRRLRPAWPLDEPDRLVDPIEGIPFQ